MKTQLVGLAYVFVILPVFLFGWSQFQDYQFKEDAPAKELSSPEVCSIIYHEVEDYDRWKAEFDDFEETRKQHGELSYEVGILENQPNTVYVWNTWKSEAHYKKFQANEDLKERMSTAGVLNEPTFLLLEKKEGSNLKNGKVRSIIYHKVEDYDKWKKEFDAFASKRKSSGEKGYEVGTLNNNSKKVYVINSWDNAEDYNSFIKDEELKAAMEKAGVIGEPKFLLLMPKDKNDW